MPVERPRLAIGFFTAGPPFHAASLESGGLGGSETALIQAAQGLALRGHQVTVFNNCPAPGVHGGVSYLDRRDYARFAAATAFDVFIVSRYYGFFQVPIPARLKVLWNHDTLDDPASLRRVEGNIDLFFTLSRFHADNYTRRLPSVAGRMVMTKNGIDLGLIERARAQARARPNQVIYASRPERGLEPLLKRIWPRLKEARPELELVICGYDAPGQGLPAATLRLYAELETLIQETPGVRALGSLAKPEYYRLLASSAFMLYPCVFPEISCIAALEAQALGRPVLTSAAFALAETVKTPEFMAQAPPGSQDWAGELFQLALKTLDQPDQAAALAQKAREQVIRQYAWESILEQWERVFGLMLKSRKPSPPARRTGLRKKQLKVLFLHSKHLLIQEITHGLKALGHEPRLVMLPAGAADQDQLLARLEKLVEEFRPDFALTVNHLGLDAEGVLAGWLEARGLALASWFVDSPLMNLHQLKLNHTSGTAYFLWDRDYLAPLKRLGLGPAAYLPLAADTTVFHPGAARQAPLSALACPISFVGNSMTSAVSEKTRALGLENGAGRLVDQAARSFMGSTALTPEEDIETSGLAAWAAASSLGQAMDLSALVIWRATQLYRAQVLGRLAPLEPRIIGDEAWERLLPQNGPRWLGPLNYYQQLPRFYPLCQVNLNLTSLQMKTGLNQRVFDAPACGAFVLSDHRDQLTEHFRLGREAVTFQTAGEALDLARFYLENPGSAQKIAQAGHARIIRDHTYPLRISSLIETLRQEFC